MQKNELLEHPFAEYIRILGKGKRGSRPLTREEAYRAMAMILNDQVEEVQLGAFLMLMRVKEETAEELAGFVEAARDTVINPCEMLTADLDWSSYAGKRRHLPWFVLSALLLAENGVRVLMHGASGHTAGRLYTDAALNSVGIGCAATLAEAAGQIKDRNFSYIALKDFSPKLDRIMNLRPLLGLRSPVHTLARMVNPSSAPYSVQGIFHPGYRPVHQEAALLLKQPHMSVLKGEGGEVERNPDAACLVQSVHDGVLSDEEWPALFKKRHLKPDQLEPSLLGELWRGEYRNEFAEASVTGTAAVALKLLGKAGNREDAENLAKELWRNRDVRRLQAA
ncbi:MAG: glycosyl transferase family protein [Gammaproteobacteria bacterium]